VHRSIFQSSFHRDKYIQREEADKKLTFNPLFIETGSYGPFRKGEIIAFNPLFIETRNSHDGRLAQHSVLSILFSSRLQDAAISHERIIFHFQSSFHRDLTVSNDSLFFSFKLSILFSSRQRLAYYLNDIRELTFNPLFIETL